MKKSILFLGMFFYLQMLFSSNADPPVVFSQSDRDRLIRMEAILEQHEKRFEQMDKRFEQMQQEMNRRFEQMQQEMNNRFEQVDKRFEELYTVLWIIVGIFTAITSVTIGFAIWDRRTMIRPFESKVKELEANIDEIKQKPLFVENKVNELDKKIEEIKKEPLAKQLIDALKEKAKTDKEFERILRAYHLI